MVLNLHYHLKEAQRVLRQTRKPKSSEFQETARIKGVGIVVIGIIGFAVFMIAQVLRYLL